MKFIEDRTSFQRFSLPYVLQEQPDGSHIALNRNYKPIGFRHVEKRVDYAAYPISFRFKDLSPDTIRQLSIQGHSKGDIYLYKDSCVPILGKKHMKAYLEKLAILMAQQVC